MGFILATVCGLEPLELFRGISWDLFSRQFVAWSHQNYFVGFILATVSGFELPEWLSEYETIHIPCQSRSKFRDVTPCQLEEKVEVDESGKEQHGGAPISDAQIGSSTMAQETPKEVKDDDKLLVLREVLQKSGEKEVDKQKQARDDDKYAKLRKRQKGRLLLKDAGKEPVSSSRPVGPKQRSDNSEILKSKVSNAPSSSSMSLKGKGVAVPNAVLPKVTENVSGSSGSLQSSKSSALNKNDGKITPLGRKPAGYLKRNTKPSYWSELELDALWVGVRRYGLADWERILTDSRGVIFKNNRTAQDLSSRWNMELLKIFPFPPPPSTSAFPPIYGTSHDFASLITPPHLHPNLMFPTFHHHQNQRSVMMMESALQAPPAKGNLFPTRPEFPRVKDNKNNAGGRDHPIAVDSDSEQDSSEGSEKTLPA